MKKKTGEIGSAKTFALGGRFLGDIGECLASYLFDARLYKKQKTGHDGLVGDKRIEVKVRSKYGENEEIKKIRISKESLNPGDRKSDETGFYLIIFSFELTNRKINIEFNKLVPFDKQYNGTAKFFNAWVNYFKGKKCGPSLKIKKDKATNIGGWTIMEEKEGAN